MQRKSATGSPLSAAFGFMAGYAPVMHAVLRIGAGLLFLEHGLMKLFGWFGAPAPVPLVSLMGLAGVLELFGGLLIVVGFAVRPVALVLAVEMLVAYGMAHMPRGLAPVQNQGELALLYMLVFAYLAAAGAGPASVDDKLEGRPRL